MSKAPICDNCGIQMVERINRIGDGSKFYGCPNWPKCDETAEHEDNLGIELPDDYLD